jgi:hypothetical protein
MVIINYIFSDLFINAGTYPRYMEVLLLPHAAINRLFFLSFVLIGYTIPMKNNELQSKLVITITVITNSWL